MGHSGALNLWSGGHAGNDDENGQTFVTALRDGDARWAGSSGLLLYKIDKQVPKILSGTTSVWRLSINISRKTFKKFFFL